MAQLSVGMSVQLSHYPIPNHYSSRKFPFLCHFCRRAELAHESRAVDSAVPKTHHWLGTLVF